ncbi:MAG: hypothetical protein Q9M82_04080 [Mariprofundus sp.]|nr:hypothetical protein [Mariprofundus sp.]
MKLTLAMGLHYDNDKSANLYALTIGQPRKKTALVQEVSMAAYAPVPSQISNAVIVGQGALSMLTYNLKGVPIPFAADSANINLFA